MSWTSKKIGITICATCMSFFGFAMAPGQSNVLSVDKLHLSGVAESHVGSLEAWQAGDLLIRYSMTGEGKLIADGVGEVVGPDALTIVVQENYLSRFAFDFRSERALIINQIQRDEFMFNSLDEEVRPPRKQIDNRVLLFDKAGNKEFVRTDMGQIQLGEVASSLTGSFSCIARMRVPDLRHLGCVESGNWDIDALRERVDFSNSVDNIDQITHISNDVYRVVAKDLQTGRFRGWYATDWDVSRNVPVRFESHHVPNSTKPVQITTVEWKSINGLFVPKQARKSNRKIVLQDGRQFHLREEVTLHVHCFSLNQELPAELFDEQLIHDRKKLDDMLNTDVFDKTSTGRMESDVPSVE